MSKEQTKDLLKFLKPFSKEIIERALWLREFIWDLYPQANELIYDNYNALLGGRQQTGLDILFALLPLGAQARMFILVFIGEARSPIPVKSFWEKGINIATSWYRIRTNFPRLTSKNL